MVEDRFEGKRTERWLLALNRAAFLMERALTPEEIFAAAAGELGKLSLSCVVLLVDAEQDLLHPVYLSYQPEVLGAAEKMAGIKAEGFSVPIESVEVCRQVVRERKTVFHENERLLRQLLSAPARGFTRRIVNLLKLSKGIGAPLVIQDEVLGMLAVHSESLEEEDIPAITAFAHWMAAAWHKVNLLADLESNLQALRRTQAQLLQVQKMEAMGRLAGGLAHDFNNFLTPIMGYSQFLMDGLTPDDPQWAQAQEILTTARQMASLIRQLLAFSRKQMLTPEVVDLNAIVSDMERILGSLFGEEIELVTKLDPTLRRVKADPNQLQQVIMNLAVNGRDAMMSVGIQRSSTEPSGFDGTSTNGVEPLEQATERAGRGTLTIWTQNVTFLQPPHTSELFPGAQPGQFVCLAVTDTGVGMDEEVMARLFEPFFTTKEPGRGTGLGLSVVYGVVHQHGGWINVYSEPGQGSTFKVYLPVLPEGAEGEEKTLEVVAAPLHLEGRGEGVLVVEDDERVRRFVAQTLSTRGYGVLVASSVREALETFGAAGGEIHLVFSDVSLPDGTGLELVDELLSRQRDLGVLLSSGHMDSRSRLAVIRSREIPFVQKPYTLTELLRAVRQAIDRD